MRVIDILTSPWAIDPPKLIEIRDIYTTHLRGDKIDIKGIEAKLGRPLINEEQHIDVVRDVAIIPLHGVVAKRLNFFSSISGGASTEIFKNQIKQAAFNDDIKAIILHADGPGGTVDGTFEAADVVYQARDHKPVITFIDGTAASATYLISAGAERLFISGPVTQVGSIGVVATHVDESQLEKNIGIKTTEITAGKFKRVASNFEPLSKEGRADIQAQVDFIYTIFVEKVALFRGVSVETVLNDMADGRVFIGQQAIDAGLVDGVSTLDALVEQLSNGVLPQDISIGALSDIEANRVIAKLEQEDNEMGNQTDITKGYLLANHPEVAESLIEDGKKTIDVKQIETDAKKAECDRIQGVYEQSVPGHEDLITSLMFDGKTDAGMAAVKIIQADKQTRKDVVADLEADAPAPVNHVDAPPPKLKETKIDPNLPIEERCKIAWDKDPELRAEMMNDFDAYLEGERADEGGQVKILGRRDQ